MTTLDGVERTLSAEDLLVCDADRRPQAIAGIMGGAEAEVQGDTTEILLEAAYFQPMGISRSSKRLGLRSESSARFERGVDPNGVLTGSARAAELLQQVAAAQRRARTRSTSYPDPVSPARITVRTARVEALLGVDARPGAGQGRVATARDRGRGRRRGLRRHRADLPTRPGPRDRHRRGGRAPGRPQRDPAHACRTRRTPMVAVSRVRQRERRLLADVLVGTGAAEAMTVPLIAPADLERFGLPTDGTVEATNALRAEEPLLRPAILPGLLKAAAFNAGQGLADLALFELGHVFARAAGTPAAARRARPPRVAADRDGAAQPDRARPTGRRVRRGRCARRARRGARSWSTCVSWPDRRPASIRRRAAAITVDGAPIGHVGVLAAPVPDAFGVPAGAVAFELDIDGLLRRPAARPRVPAALAVPGVEHRPGVRARRHRSRRRRRADAARALWETCSKRCGCFDEFRSDVARAAAPQPGVRAAAPGPRPHADGHRDRRAPAGRDRRGGRRPTTPSCAGDQLTLAVRPPDPPAVRRGRPAGRGVQRALAHVLRRRVHAVLRVARLRRRKRRSSSEFDVMIVKAVLEWEGPAGFDDFVDIVVEPVRLGTKSFDLRYRASVEGRPACTGVITYVNVKPSTHESAPIPAEVRDPAGGGPRRSLIRSPRARGDAVAAGEPDRRAETERQRAASTRRDGRAGSRARPRRATRRPA